MKAGEPPALLGTDRESLQPIASARVREMMQVYGGSGMINRLLRVSPWQFAGGDPGGTIVFEALDQLVVGLRKVREVAQKVRDAETQSALADVTLDSAQLKIDMATVLQENMKLREEVEHLRKQADVRSNLQIRDGLYYLSGQVSGYPQGPFCTRCLDCDGKLVTLLGPGWQLGRRGGVGTVQTPTGVAWTCPECIRSSG